MFARRIAILSRRHHPTGNGAPGGWREQPQRIPAVSPSPAGALLGIEDDEREICPAQEVRRCQGGLSSANDDYIPQALCMGFHFTPSGHGQAPFSQVLR
ncbi:hypothetical protein D3C76_698040 [compost metagenome]